MKNQNQKIALFGGAFMAAGIAQAEPSFVNSTISSISVSDAETQVYPLIDSGDFDSLIVGPGAAWVSPTSISATITDHFAGAAAGAYAYVQVDDGFAGVGTVDVLFEWDWTDLEPDNGFSNGRGFIGTVHPGGFESVLSVSDSNHPLAELLGSTSGSRLITLPEGVDYFIGVNMNIGGVDAGFADTGFARFTVVPAPMSAVPLVIAFGTVLRRRR
jgi:hypothetical protein